MVRCMVEGRVGLNLRDLVVARLWDDSINRYKNATPQVMKMIN